MILVGLIIPSLRLDLLNRDREVRKNQLLLLLKQSQLLRVMLPSQLLRPNQPLKVMLLPSQKLKVKLSQLLLKVMPPSQRLKEMPLPNQRLKVMPSQLLKVMPKRKHQKTQNKRMKLLLRKKKPLKRRRLMRVKRQRQNRPKKKRKKPITPLLSPQIKKHKKQQDLLERQHSKQLLIKNKMKQITLNHGVKDQLLIMLEHSKQELIMLVIMISKEEELLHKPEIPCNTSATPYYKTCKILDSMKVPNYNLTSCSMEYHNTLLCSIKEMVLLSRDMHTLSSEDKKKNFKCFHSFII